MSKLLSFPNDLGSLFERFCNEATPEIDYDCVGSGGGSVEFELDDPATYDAVIVRFKAYLNEAVDKSVLDLAERDAVKLYDDPNDWQIYSSFVDAMDAAVTTWGQWVGTAVWPQGRDRYRVCDGCHKDTGKPLTDEELPRGAYIVT